MARGFDELIEFLLEEIALRGEQGASSSDFKDLLLKFYFQPEDTGSSGKASATRPPPHIDRRLQEKIWAWLTVHRDICIENYHCGSPPTLDEFERLENSQTTQNGESTTDAPENDASSNTQANPQAPRLFVNEDRMWQAITGHGVDPKKVPRHEFIVLSIIAAHGEDGVVQPEITRISGQDKRSVPRRTDNLQKNGYITKTHVLAKGTRTSLCTLKKFAKAQQERRKALPDVDHTSPPELVREVIFEGGLLIYDRFFDVLMGILKQCTIITFDDCKSKLGIKTKTWEMKSLWRSMRRLEGLGLVKKVKAQIKGLVVTQKWYRCIKLTRQPTPRDRVVFVTMSMRAANRVKNEQADAGGDEDAEHDVESAEDEDNDGHGAGQAPLGAENDVEEIERLPPQWDPDRPLTNLFWDVIDDAGPSGTTTAIIRSRALGSFYKRPVDSMLGRISDIWHISQPDHLRHFAVVRDTGISGKYIHYIYRSFANFQIAVDRGEAAWEVVVTQPVNPNVSKVKPRAKGGKHIREKAQTDYGPMDEWGFPQITPSAFQGQDGMATLEESNKAIFQSGLKSLPSRGYIPRFITNGFKAGARDLPADSDEDGDSSFTDSPRPKSKPRTKPATRTKKPTAKTPLLKRATTHAQAQRDSQQTPEVQGNIEVEVEDFQNPSPTKTSPSTPRRPKAISSRATPEASPASPPTINAGKKYRLKAKAEKAAPIELWEEGKRAMGLGLDDPFPVSDKSTVDQDPVTADASLGTTNAITAGDDTEPPAGNETQEAQDGPKLTGRQRHKLRLEAEKTRQAEEAKRRERELEIMGIDSFAIAERAEIILQRMINEEEQSLHAAGNMSQPGLYINPPGSQKPRDPLKRGRPKKALVAVIVLPALRHVELNSSEFTRKVAAAGARAPMLAKGSAEDSPPPSPRPHQSSKRPRLYTPAEVCSDGTASQEGVRGAENAEKVLSGEPSVMIENHSNSVGSGVNDQGVHSTSATVGASRASTSLHQELPPIFPLLDEMSSNAPQQLPSAYEKLSTMPMNTGVSSPSKEAGTVPNNTPATKKRGRPRKNPETTARPRKSAKISKDDTPAQTVSNDVPSHMTLQDAANPADIDQGASTPSTTDAPCSSEQRKPSQPQPPAGPVQQNQAALERYFNREKPKAVPYQSPYSMPERGAPRHQGLYDSLRPSSSGAQRGYKSPYAKTGAPTAITSKITPRQAPDPAESTAKPRSGESSGHGQDATACARDEGQRTPPSSARESQSGQAPQDTVDSNNENSREGTAQESEDSRTRLQNVSDPSLGTPGQKESRNGVPQNAIRMQDSQLAQGNGEAQDRPEGPLVLKDDQHNATALAQASEPILEEPSPIEQEPKWTGPTLRKGKERATNEPFINPNPSEVPIKHKKGKWQQGRKQGVKLGSGGILNYNRSKLLCDILEKCNGVFPGDFEIQRPFIGLWKKEHGSDRLVDRDTVKRTIKNAIDTGKVRRLTYTFKDKKGAMVSRHILTLPHIDPKSPLVLETQRKVIEAMPRVYWPPEMKHYEDELGNSWYGERYERETELTVQRESLPKWMRETQLRSAEDHKRREADLKRSLQKGPRAGPRSTRSTRGRPRGSALRGRATGRMRLAGLPRPRSGSDAEIQPWSAIETSLHNRPGSAYGLPEMSELPQFLPAERRGCFSTFQTDNFVFEDPTTYSEVTDSDYESLLMSRPGTPGYPRRTRRGSIFSTASSVAPSPRGRRSKDSWDTSFSGSASSSRRSSLARTEPEIHTRLGTPVIESSLQRSKSAHETSKWHHTGPETYDPEWEIQQLTTLTDPDQRFYCGSGTFSTEYFVTRNARLSLWTHRVERVDYQRSFENLMPRSLAELKQRSKMKGKERDHSRRENPYWSMFDRETLEIQNWEKSLRLGDRDPLLANYRVKEPHFINHNFYGEHISPDFDMSSTPLFDDYWSEYYTISEPPPLDPPFDVEDDDDAPGMSITVGPPPAKRFRRKTVVNTPDTRPNRPLVKKKVVLGTSNRNPFADPNCVITTADTKKLLYAMVVVQSLVGGLDNTTSWDVIRRIFDMHPHWDLPAFRNRWTWLKTHCAQVLDKLFDDFQRAFLLAYECGDVPPLNYDKPDDYDWSFIVEWTMQNISVKPPRELDPNSDLPASREALDAKFIIEENIDRVDPPRETLFNEATLAARRKELYNEYSFYISLTSINKPVSKTKRKGFAEAVIEKAKSWVRATIVAPDHMFNAAAAKEKLSRLNAKLIEKATNELTATKWFRNEFKGRGNRPGRQYGVDKNFPKAFERQLQAPHLIDAMRFKIELDTAFSSGAEAYSIRTAANEGKVLATINLLNSGHIKVIPRLPQVNHTVGAPFPRLTKFGFTEGHYKTVQMDRTRMHWEMDIVPTEHYIFGNPLLHIKKIEALPQKLPLPPQGSSFEDWIPLWYDIQLSPIREWWCRTVAGVLHVIFGRPGIGAKGIRKALKEAIGEWELELCLAGLKEIGAIEEMRLGLEEEEATRGWRLGEWWWCCLGTEAMVQAA
ncbi:hypothetical protein JOL62DRAFT_561574 [Phyllosticta paracitricarpa]|uniref:B-block binding subunit of TFIIIC domain-containing protein n=1 Tax=Phyllosticta paracitricarpa TaxID=2016321 RepID=A0ABR1NJZ0_9PEZI